MQMRRSGTKATMTAVVGLIAAMTCVMPAYAVDIVDDPQQIDDRATQLLQASNSLCWEIHRFHQQRPDYLETYRATKEIWSQAGQLREALRAGPVETDILKQQTADLNAAFAQIELTLSKWDSGDRSQIAANPRPGPRTIVTPGVEVDIPFVGVRLGGPQVVAVDDGVPQFDRRRLHPNSRGSKRSLERDLAAVKLALSYLTEDVGITAPPNSAATTPTEIAPDPQAPKPGLDEPKKPVPPVVTPPRK